MEGQVQKREERGVTRPSGNGHVRLLPRTDIIERPDDIVVLLDLPGVDDSMLNIDIEDQKLMVSAEVPEPNTEGMELRRREFRAPSYSRQFSLSEWVDVEKVEAKLKDGVLRIVLPKSERSKPRKITVKAT